MKADIIDWKCVAQCPICNEYIEVDPDEVKYGGCYCAECDKGFDLCFE